MGAVTGQERTPAATTSHDGAATSAAGTASRARAMTPFEAATPTPQA